MLTNTQIVPSLANGNLFKLAWVLLPHPQESLITVLLSVTTKFSGLFQAHFERFLSQAQTESFLEGVLVLFSGEIVIPGHSMGAHCLWLGFCLQAFSLFRVRKYRCCVADSFFKGDTLWGHTHTFNSYLALQSFSKLLLSYISFLTYWGSHFSTIPAVVELD